MSDLVFGEVCRHPEYNSRETLATYIRIAGIAGSGSVSGGWSTTVPTGIGFAALSLLPAVLLAISLGTERAAMQRMGWLLGAGAAVLHVLESFAGEAFHRAALMLVTFGFVLLPALAVYSLRRQQRSIGRILVPSALVLFAVSFVHFGDAHALHPWTTELAIHHAGIPLALYIVLQKYRCLLLDVFVRALGSSLLAGVFTLGLVWTSGQWRLREVAFADPSTPVWPSLQVARCLLRLRGSAGTLVNVTQIRKMAALSSQRWLLTLHNNQEFIVSKRQARTVREILDT